jgi:hypothetical protein
MADTVNVLGHAVSKKMVYLGSGVAVVGGVLIMREIKSRQAAAAAATAVPATDGTDTSQQDGIDANSYGDYAYDTTGGDYGSANLASLYNPATGSYLLPGVGTTVPTVSTNAEWAQEAISYFQGNGDTGDYSDAIGTALQGMCLPTAAQLQLVDNAASLLGQPPQGFPTAPHICPTPGTTGTGGGTGTTTGAMTTVPHVVGMQVNPGITALTHAGFKPGIHQTRDPKDTYIINSQTPGAGAKAPMGSTVDLGIAPHKF